MAQIMEGGADMFNALAHSMPHPNTVNYLQSQLNQPVQAINDASQQFIQQANEAYERFASSDSMRLARAAVRMVGNAWEMDTIRPMHDIGEIQQAKPTMQRWVMALPDIRKLYHQQQCDGYGETYRDIDPGMSGEQQYDYRRVMDGFVEVTDDGWEATQYFEDLIEGDRDLLLEEQSDIMSTWSRVRQAIHERDEDPTSKWNATL